MEQAAGVRFRCKEVFCTNEVIAKSTFYYWRNKLQWKESRKDFISLVVKPETSIRQQHYKALTESNSYGTTKAGTDDYFLEVVYHNGKLRIKRDLDLNGLRELVYFID